MPPRQTAFVCDERFFWLDTGTGALDLPSGGYVEPGVFGENPATKRRARNLLEVSGLLADLVLVSPRELSAVELRAFHTEGYIARIRVLSQRGGGDAGDGSTPFGRGAFEIAALAAGACVKAVEAVLDGAAANAYVLVRPPGHHAQPDAGAGFCIFNNVVLAGLAARERGLERIAIVDWDAHHGNGTQQAFWTRRDVLFVSVHEDGYYPAASGTLREVGEGDGTGYTVNVPLPSGAGDGAFVAAFDRIVVPIILRFKPELILVSSGLDANYFDPFSHLAVTSEGFRRVTRMITEAASSLQAGLVCCHEGGYSEGYVPFCLLAVMESLSGRRTAVEDPFLPAIAHHSSRTLQPAESQLLDDAAAAFARYWSD